MRAWAEIDLGAFRSNLWLLRAAIGPGVKLLAVLKADAYGHGAAALAPRAIEGGCDSVGVGDVSEALELREGGYAGGLLILGTLTADEMDAAVRCAAEVTLHGVEDLEELSRAAARRRRRVRAHLEVDTGMSRLGLAPSEAPAFARRAAAFPEIELAGLSTHLSSVASADGEYTAGQLARYREVEAALRAEGFSFAVRHVANTAGTLRQAAAHFDMVRCGIGLYGIDPGLFEPMGYVLRPIMSLRTRVALVRDVAAGRAVGYDQRFRASQPVRVAVCTAGYYDGVPFRLTNQGEVLVRGRRARILGSVTMDYLMADVTSIPECAPGDTVTIFGEDGGDRISVVEVARRAGTIPYEITCGIGRRVRRLYVERAARSQAERLPLGWVAAL